MVNPVSGSGSSNNLASPYSGLMRVSGMASGMDIDGMVSQLMKAERIPLDKLNQKKQILEWQRDDYRDMYSSFYDFDQSIFTGIGMQSSFNKKTVTSSDSNKVVATAVNATNNISTSISVARIATATSWGGNGTNTGYVKADRTLTFDVYANGQKTNTDPIKIDIKATDELADVASKINGSKLGVTAMVQNILDSSTNTYKETLVFTNNQTGSGYSIQTNDTTRTTNDFMASLGFQFDTTNQNLLVPSTDGQDALVTINGFQTQQKSNNFTINGISYTVKGKTTDANNVDTPVNISSTTDVDAIYDSIKSFVDKYNDLIKKVNDKTSEKRNRDYQPLTDEQRQAMTETQVKLWEDKAKSGLLSNDSVLSNGLNRMRQDLYTPVSGTNVTDGFTQLAQIGIKTSSDFLENGKLEITEATLRQKIQENPQAIYQLFNSNGDTYETKGLAKRLRDSIKITDDQIIDKAGKVTSSNNQFLLGKQLTDVTTQITDFQSKLSDIENRYYSQFTAMEQAMQRANQQAAYLAQQFGG